VRLSRSRACLDENRLIQELRDRGRECFHLPAPQIRGSGRELLDLKESFGNLLWTRALP
jgi:hypothetical protein